MAGQLQFDFPNFELWHAGTACDHLGAIASQRFRFFVSRLNNLAFCRMLGNKTSYCPARQLLRDQPWFSTILSNNEIMRQNGPLYRKIAQHT